MDTFFGPYFDFCLELALETWAKASLTQSFWVHDPKHTHSLAGFWWSGLSDQRALHLTECCLQVQKWCLYKGRGVVPGLVCANKVRNGPASTDQGFSTVSQGSCHAHGTPCWNPPPSPYPAFLLIKGLMQHHIVGFLQTLTSYSSILWVALIAPDSRAPRAVNKLGFIATAANIVQKDGASASTKVGISKRHCIYWKGVIIWNAIIITPTL